MSDVIVIGAGAAGLATAVCLRRAGLRVRIIDRHGAIGGAYRLMDPAIVMTSPSRIVGLPDSSTRHLDRYATAGAYAEYLADYARTHDLVPEQGVVEAVVSGPAGYAVKVRRNATVSELEIPAVVLATGMFDTPAVPTIAGRIAVPALHASAFRASHLATAHHVVVIGGASSAIEIAELAARHSCKVTVATRKLAITRATVLGVDPAFALVPLLSRISPRKFCEGRFTVPGTDRGFAKLRESGAITVAPPVIRIDDARCTFADGRSVNADLVVFATGYRYTLPALPTGVPMTVRGIPRCDRGRSLPGLWFVGLPCARSAASEYLYGIARDAEYVARHITA